MIVRPLGPGEGEQLLAWRYEGRYTTYDLTEPPTADGGHFAVEDSGALVGYCCFGAEARVPGVEDEEEDGVLDIGYGMRPDLLGQGRGASFVSAILAFGVRELAPRRLRMSILRWNERSRRASERQGFRIVARAGEFDVLEREP